MTARKRHTRLVLMLVALALCGTSAVAQNVPSSSCGSLDNAFGPFDYTDAAHRREHLPVVERHHFTSEVQQLRRGVMNETPLGDLEYTLRAFPNHHLALDAMARFHRQENTEHLRRGQYSLPCWFDRARRFRPNDGAVPLIQGVHMFYRGELEEAEEHLLRAVELMPHSAEAHYNLGLLQVRLGKYAAARESAQKAYAMGFPLPGLQQQLARLGEWRPGE